LVPISSLPGLRAQREAELRDILLAAVWRQLNSAGRWSIQGRPEALEPSTFVARYLLIDRSGVSFITRLELPASVQGCSSNACLAVRQESGLCAGTLSSCEAKLTVASAGQLADRPRSSYIFILGCESKPKFVFELDYLIRLSIVAKCSLDFAVCFFAFPGSFLAKLVLEGIEWSYSDSYLNVFSESVHY